MSASAMSASAVSCASLRLPSPGRRLAVIAGMTLALSVAGCTDFPDMTGRLSEADQAGGYPALVPAERLLEGTQDVAIAPDTQTSLEDRVTALDRRAEALRATELDNQTRDRMQSGVRADQP